MGKVIRVTPEELESASKKVAEISDTYTSIYNQLINQAGQMGSAWEGEDNLAFVNQINGFCEELKQMADKLKVASDALMKQKINYAQRQEANITQVKQLIN